MNIHVTTILLALEELRKMGHVAINIIWGWVQYPNFHVFDVSASVVCEEYGKLLVITSFTLWNDTNLDISLFIKQLFLF